MKIGVYMFPPEYAMPLVDLAVALEARGFESLFVPEHTHIPSGRQTPWPSGGDLPKEYSHTLDPFVGLMAAAAATRNLRIGTGICLLTERDPIVTAKEVATLELLSNGRFEFGIGAGWKLEEMENHGTVFDTRFRVMVDRAKAMQAIWTQDAASYHGEFTQFDAIWSWPKPVQKPHPPVFLGGKALNAFKRVVEWGDGWMPNHASVEEIRQGRETLNRLAKEAGRDPSTIQVMAFGMSGQYRDREAIKDLEQAGVSRVTIWLDDTEKSGALREIEEIARQVLD